jgi:hypothetical protein
VARSFYGILLGVCVFLALAELVCRVLPVSTATKAGYHIDPRILTYAPQHRWRYATGWDLRFAQTIANNSHGFVADRAFTRNPNAVALIGDSYVEAASLDAADRPAAQLERALQGKRPVYAMGAAGTALLDYAERIRYAHEQFGVRDFVVLMERGDIEQALCGSGNVTSQCLDAQTLAPRTEPVPPPTALKLALRESAFAQYLASQLKLAPAKLTAQVFKRDVPGHGEHPAAAALTPAALNPAVDAITAEFFARTRPHVGGKLVIVVDADRQALMQRRASVDPTRQRFITLARAAGATVVDTEEIFKPHYARSALSLDLSPRDAHFNPMGVRLLAAAMAQALRE